MGKLFDYEKFQAHMETWVGEVDDPGLNRTWEIIKECVISHASVDREPKQSVAGARRAAWVEFAEAYRGRDSTFTVFGMIHEISGACADIGRGEDLDAQMGIAIGAGGGLSEREEPIQEPAPEPEDNPKLYLIINQDMT